MIDQHKLVCVLLTLLLMTAGCAGEDNIWGLDMGGHDEEVENGYRFVGDVSLGGHYEDVSVGGVRVKILDAQNETLETVFIGTLNVSRPTAEINTTVERRPKYVLVFVDGVTAPQSDNEESGISGLKRVESGDYYSYTDYDPYVSSNRTSS